MSAGPDLPPIELIAIDGEDLGVEPEGRPEVDRSRRRRNALVALGVAVAGLVVVGVLTRDDPPPTPTLREWAAEHHVGEPLDGIPVPATVTCNMDPYDLPAVVECLRTATERGLPASGHLMFDGSYPEAIDVWLTFHEDDTATMVQRLVSPEPHPDRDVPSISPNSLKRVDTIWDVSTCGSITFLDDDDVFPGFECDPFSAPVVPETRAELSRPLTEEEREDLIRRFACTFPDMYTAEEC